MEKFEIYNEFDNRSGDYTRFIKGKITKKNNVVFYFPFEPTVKDLHIVLSNFRKRYSVTDDSKVKIRIKTKELEKHLKNGNNK